MVKSRTSKEPKSLKSAIEDGKFQRKCGRSRQILPEPLIQKALEAINAHVKASEFSEALKLTHDVFEVADPYTSNLDPIRKRLVDISRELIGQHNSDSPNASLKPAANFLCAAVRYAEPSKKGHLANQALTLADATLATKDHDSTYQLIKAAWHTTPLISRKARMIARQATRAAAIMADDENDFSTAAKLLNLAWHSYPRNDETKLELAADIEKVAYNAKEGGDLHSAQTLLELAWHSYPKDAASRTKLEAKLIDVALSANAEKKSSMSLAILQKVQLMGASKASIRKQLLEISQQTAQVAIDTQDLRSADRLLWIARQSCEQGGSKYREIVECMDEVSTLSKELGQTPEKRAKKIAKKVGKKAAAPKTKKKTPEGPSN